MVRDTSRDKYSICKICGDRITLRLPGSSYWKLDSDIYKDTAKHQHETTFVFESGYDTMVVDRLATKIFYRDKFSADGRVYRKNRNICIERACDELGYVQG